VNQKLKCLSNAREYRPISPTPDSFGISLKICEDSVVPLHFTMVSQPVNDIPYFDKSVNALHVFPTYCILLNCVFNPCLPAMEIAIAIIEEGAYLATPTL
jgi:hypothetical protein